MSQAATSITSRSSSENGGRASTSKTRRSSSENGGRTSTSKTRRSSSENGGRASTSKTRRSSSVNGGRTSTSTTRRSSSENGGRTSTSTTRRSSSQSGGSIYTSKRSIKPRDIKRLAKYGFSAGLTMADHFITHKIFEDSEEETETANLKTSISFVEADSGVQEAKRGTRGHANAGFLQVDISAGGIPEAGNLLAVDAGYEVLAASSGAEISVLGGRANAGATVGRVQIGLKGTPFYASLSGPTVGAGAGAHLFQTGLYVSAHAGEAQLGPFSIRAGLTFGFEFVDLVPTLHTGPISVSCTIM